jgi:hypothetical protein
MGGPARLADYLEATTGALLAFVAALQLSSQSRIILRRAALGPGHGSLCEVVVALRNFQHRRLECWSLEAISEDARLCCGTLPPFTSIADRGIRQ